MFCYQGKQHSFTFWVIIFMLVVNTTSCTNNLVPPNQESADYQNFSSYADFRGTLLEIAGSTDETERTTRINIFWDSLVANHQVPFALGDSVAFLYKKDGANPFWAGDFNGWNPSWQGKQAGLSNVFMYETIFPADSRLDYKIVDNGRWMLDPANEYQQYGGFGPNSELRMPEWVYPEETIVKENVLKGNLSNNFSIESTSLAYKVQYKVYTPYNYDSETNLPVIYVTDGQDYADEKLGSMITVLDNLIFDGAIKPVIAVFIDPRNPDKLSENRRAEEYRSNIKFANFVADELATAIDSQFRTSASANDRAILGASYGGWNASYFGLVRSDKFQLIGIHSPSTSNEIIQAYEKSASLPIKVFMSTGVIFDTEEHARTLKAVLESKNYPLRYLELNQGHSWGNWREMLKPTLTYFFGTSG
jgi:enterochelin esterase-like enzyme